MDFYVAAHAAGLAPGMKPVTSLPESSGTALNVKYRTAQPSRPLVVSLLCETCAGFPESVNPWEAWPTLRSCTVTVTAVAGKAGAYDPHTVQGDPATQEYWQKMDEYNKQFLGTGGDRPVAQIAAGRTAMQALSHEVEAGRSRRAELAQEQQELVRELFTSGLSNEEYGRQLAEINAEVYATYNRAFEDTRRLFGRAVIDEALPTEVPPDLYFKPLDE
jgi:hypothetical protein